MFREQEHLESFEDFMQLDEASAELLDRELKTEDQALSELGGDIHTAFGSAAALSEVNAEAAAETEAEVDQEVDQEAEQEQEQPVIIAVPVRRKERPLVNATKAKIIDPNPRVTVPVVVSHPVGLRTIVTPVQANTLLTRLYDKNPITPFAIGEQLPTPARAALYKVLSKTNDPEIQIAVCASFLAAFTTDNIGVDAEMQEKSAALLEAQDDKQALANTEPHFENREAVEASLAETSAANTPAKAAVIAATPAAVNPKVEKKVKESTEQLDSGVNALRKYADVLEGEALLLSKKLEELARLHKGSIFKAMDRGPVGRRDTAKDRRQVFTNGVRSWEAEATNNAMRGRHVAQNEADRIFTVEPIPK